MPTEKLHSSDLLVSCTLVPHCSLLHRLLTNTWIGTATLCSPHLVRAHPSRHHPAPSINRPSSQRRRRHHIIIVVAEPFMRPRHGRVVSPPRLRRQHASFPCGGARPHRSRFSATTFKALRLAALTVGRVATMSSKVRVSFLDID
ncbi:hypothetical protein ACSQ67_000868 [Phaseolus vulgaris]